MAQELRHTNFAEIGIVPDLTREQRRDEGEMGKEAERRNESRSQDDMAKNLTWKVKGRRGEKWLIKSVEREGGGGPGHRGRGGGGPQRGRGGAQNRRGRGGAWAPGGPARVVTAIADAERERGELLDLVRGGMSGTQTRARANSKRTRDEGEEEEEVRQAPQPPMAMTL